MAKGAIINALLALGINLLGGDAEAAGKPAATVEVRASGLDAGGRAEMEAQAERLKAENAALKKELEAQRKELIETNIKHSRQSERLKRIEASAAATMETLEPIYVGSREQEMAEALRLVSEAGASLAARTSGFCDDLDALISELPMDKVGLAKIRLRLDGLRAEAQVLAVLTSPPAPPEKFERCRILEIDKSLRTAVLSAGFRDGVRNGLLLRSGPGGAVVLRVVAVRPLACAAQAVEGDLSALLPGMEASATSK